MGFNLVSLILSFGKFIVNHFLQAEIVESVHIPPSTVYDEDRVRLNLTKAIRGKLILEYSKPHGVLASR